MGEYLTIAEYARLKGVSTSSVYKRLETSLRPWVEVVNGKKCLLSTVLDKNLKKVDNVENPNPQKVDNVENPNPQKVDNVENYILRKNGAVDNGKNEDGNQIFSILQKENLRLMQEVAELRMAVREKDDLLADYTNRFAELATQAQQIAAQAQALHAADFSKPRLSGLPGEQAEDAAFVQTDHDAISDELRDHTSAPESSEDGPVQEQKIIFQEPGKAGEKSRHGWLARLFGMN